MWKQLKLQCPVDDFCEYEADDGLIQDLQNFVGLLTLSAEILTKDHPLWTEIKVFQNIQAKYKRILHCDKCLQLLQRVGVYLRKMVLLNLSRSYLDLAEPFLKELQSQRSKRHLPSRQQLEYVLIRTQSAAKLICEALHYSRETFCYLIQRLKVGHMILNLMMATSVTARVNILFKGILVQIIDSYRKVYLWRNKLKVGTFEWPQPLDLPEDLGDWLKLEGDLIQPKQLPTEQLSFLKNIFEKKQKGESQNGTDFVIDLENEDEECMIVADTSQQNESMDFGEVISREEEHADVTSTTQEENPLLQKINTAKNYKHLRDIWENIEEWNAEGALPKKLTSIKMKKINKMFGVFRQELNQVKSERLTDEERKKQNKSIRRKYQVKLSRFLRLIPKQSSPNSSSNVYPTPEKLKPVKTLDELVNLYQELYAQLESANEFHKSKKLKKMFKSRKSDIELLLHNNEEKFAKQLIVCTSKILLTKYVV